MMDRIVRAIGGALVIIALIAVSVLLIGMDIWDFVVNKPREKKQ